MAIDDVLKPSEEMKFTSDAPIQYGGKEFNLYLTDTRLIFYKERGMIFKSDDIVSWNIEDLSNISFEEEGMINKKGIVTFATDGGKIQIKTGAEEGRAIYNQLLEYI